MRLGIYTRSTIIEESMVHTNVYTCDWLWENPPLTHKDKYSEIRNSIIQSVRRLKAACLQFATNL